MDNDYLTSLLVILEALNFDFYASFHFLKAKINQKNKIHSH